MPSALETAVDTYVKTVSEPDPQLRAKMLAACLAPDVKMLTRGGEIRGVGAMVAMIERALADPKIAGFRVTALDVKGTTFRFRSFTDFSDGTSLESMDAGHIDENGKICLLLTFAGPLVDA